MVPITSAKAKKSKEVKEEGELPLKRESFKDNRFHYTPFGVLVDTDVSRTSFDEDTFYQNIMSPAEKDTFKKYQAEFISDPAKGEGTKLTSSCSFVPWGSRVIESSSRSLYAVNTFLAQSLGLPLGSHFLTSGTWSLDRALLPDFIRLLGDLKTKFYDVLGDEELISALEKAEHRAHELMASPGEGESIASSAPVFTWVEYNGLLTSEAGPWQLVISGGPVFTARAHRVDGKGSIFSFIGSFDEVKSSLEREIAVETSQLF